MSEQVFLDFSLNFNLRQTKKICQPLFTLCLPLEGDNTRSILAPKVYPTQWNKRKQIATISNGQNKGWIITIIEIVKKNKVASCYL